jgi:Bacterial Ig domain
MKNLFKLLIVLLPLMACQTTPPDTIEPTITLNNNLNPVFLGDEITLTANATDNLGVSKVEFFLNDTSLGIDTLAPFEFLVPANKLSLGLVKFQARAFDAAGNSKLAKLGLEVTTLPSIQLLASAAQVDLGGIVKFTINSNNIPMQKIRIQDSNNTVLIEETLGSPTVKLVQLKSQFLKTGLQKLTATILDGSRVIAKSAEVNVEVQAFNIVIKMTGIEVVTVSPDDRTSMEIVGIIKAQTFAQNTLLASAEVFNRANSAPVILTAISVFPEISQTIIGTQFPDSSLKIILDLLELDDDVTNQFGTQTLNLALSGLEGSSQDAPLKFQITLDNAAESNPNLPDDKIKVQFSIFRTPLP